MANAAILPQLDAVMYAVANVGNAWLVLSPSGVQVFRVPDRATAEDLVWLLNAAHLERLAHGGH